MDNIKETLDIANQLTEQMQKLMNSYEVAVASLPLAERQQLQSVTDDINKTIKSVQAGDLNALQEISKKYAGTNSVSPIL